MVSQLNQRLAKAGVTSKHTIGLTWNGKYTDDLDIHVITPSGKEVYYGCKQADGCKLDFDANVSSGEAEPCENVSCRPGKFKVRVNNFNRRTVGETIPFQIVCKQLGAEDVIYEGVWPVNRQKGAFIDVCTHEFTEVGQAGPPTMSANAAARAKAQNVEWEARIGDATATVETSDALVGMSGVEMIACGAAGQRLGLCPAASEPAKVGRAFMEMALNSVPAPPNGKKGLFSGNCAAQPSTVSELKAHIRANPGVALAVQLRDHAPGYLVSIGTKTDGVRKTTLPAPCHFHDKHAHPVKPVPGTVGNARLDATWFNGNGAYALQGLVRVSALVDVPGSCPFLALQGARLPPQNGEAFPLASGFYPSDLSAEMHVHRERWGFCHTQMKPSMPARRSTSQMVGTFLTGREVVVYLNGVRMTLQNEAQTRQ